MQMIMRMFAVVLGALFSIPAASALILSTPDNTSPGAIIDEPWLTSPGDAAEFTLLLVDTDARESFAIETALNTSARHVEFQVPPVPASERYVLKAVNVTNFSQLYAQSDLFSIS